MIEAIIFDCFGVLVGTGFWNVYERLGGDLNKDKEFIEKLLNKANLGLISSDKLHTATSNRLKISKKEWKKSLYNDEKPNKDVFSFIKKGLKGRYKLGLLSNVGRGGLERRIPINLLELFDAIVASAEVNLIKPDPKIFIYACKKLGVSPKNAIFIDDRKEYLIGAAKIGMKTILYKNLKDLKKKLRLLL